MKKFEDWLNDISLKVAIKLGLAASISLFLEEAFTKALNRPETLINGLWSVMASLVVMQAYLGGTYQAAWKRFLGVFIGSIIGGFYISYFGGGTLNVGLGVFSTIIICSLIKLKENYRIASLSTAFIIISASLKPEIDPWLFSFFRFIDSCIGIIVAIAVSYFIWPEMAMKNLRANICKTMTSLARYYHFAANLDQETESESKRAKELSKELIELLETNRNYKQDVLIELRYHEEIFPDWSLMNSQSELLFELITFLRNVPKLSLSKIFDDSLSKAISKVVNETESAFKSIETHLSKDLPIIYNKELELSLDNLNKELLRFRETHTIRKFSLQDVEDYYIFFYNLRYIGEVIVKL